MSSQWRTLTFQELPADLPAEAQVIDLGDKGYAVVIPAKTAPEVHAELELSAQPVAAVLLDGGVKILPVEDPEHPAPPTQKMVWIEWDGVNEPIEHVIVNDDGTLADSEPMPAADPDETQILPAIGGGESEMAP